MPHGLEMVVQVAELADVAWGAHERHRETLAFEKGLQAEQMEAEDALTRERRENQKLRAALQAYENALQKELERQGSAQTLAESLHCSRETSPDLFEQLTKKVENPDYLEKLKTVSPFSDDGASAAEKKAEEDIFVTANPEDPNWWLWINETDIFESEMKEEKDGLGEEGYIVVNQEDFVDGIANFLAKYITSTPQAKKMSPEELQKTILKAFTEAEKKGKLRKLWEMGKLLYTATSWGATVFGIYRHPVVIRAASIAVWTTCSLILAMLR